jgi:hypothetical protein
MSKSDLEHFDNGYPLQKEKIRRAIAIAQAVDELPDTISWRAPLSDVKAAVKPAIIARADELLKGGGDE